jgi:hypothetical protein
VPENPLRELVATRKSFEAAITPEVTVRTPPARIVAPSEPTWRPTTKVTSATP